MPDLATRIDRAGRRAPPRRAPGGGGGPGRSRRWPRSARSPSWAGGPDTSGATVVRLAGRLGYDGWVGLQADVRAGLDHHLRPATERIREPDVRRRARPRRASREADNVHRTLDAVDRAAFDRAVALLADRRRAVRVLAGSAPGRHRRLLADDLDLLRPGVDPRRRLAGGGRQRSSRTRGPATCCVAIDLRRYERWVLDADDRRRRGRRRSSIALTDSRLSPLARRAEVDLRGRRRGRRTRSTATWARWPSPTRSITGVAARLRRPATDRLDRVEAAWQAADALTDG